MGILRENGDHLRSTISKCKLPKVKFPPRNVNFNLSLFYQNRSLSSIVIFRITKIFITICSLFSRTHRPWKKLNQNFKMGKTDFSIGKFDSGELLSRNGGKWVITRGITLCMIILYYTSMSEPDLVSSSNRSEYFNEAICSSRSCSSNFNLYFYNICS